MVSIENSRAHWIASVVDLTFKNITNSKVQDMSRQKRTYKNNNKIFDFYRAR